MLRWKNYSASSSKGLDGPDVNRGSMHVDAENSSASQGSTSGAKCESHSFLMRNSELPEKGDQLHGGLGNERNSTVPERGARMHTAKARKRSESESCAQSKSSDCLTPSQRKNVSEPSVQIHDRDVHNSKKLRVGEHPSDDRSLTAANKPVAHVRQLVYWNC